MLERARVVGVAAGERSYHIFYQMLSSPHLRQQWALPPAAECRYLHAGTVATIDTSDARGDPPPPWNPSGAHEVSHPPSPIGTLWDWKAP